MSWMCSLWSRLTRLLFKLAIGYRFLRTLQKRFEKNSGTRRDYRKFSRDIGRLPAEKMENGKCKIDYMFKKIAI